MIAANDKSSHPAMSTAGLASHANPGYAPDVEPIYRCPVARSMSSVQGRQRVAPLLSHPAAANRSGHLRAVDNLRVVPCDGRALTLIRLYIASVARRAFGARRHPWPLPKCVGPSGEAFIALGDMVFQRPRRDSGSCRVRGGIPLAPRTLSKITRIGLQVGSSSSSSLSHCQAVPKQLNKLRGKFRLEWAEFW